MEYRKCYTLLLSDIKGSVVPWIYYIVFFFILRASCATLRLKISYSAVSISA